MKKIFYIVVLIAAFCAAFIIFKPYPDSGAPEGSYSAGLHGMPAGTTTEDTSVPVPVPEISRPAPTNERTAAPKESVTVKVGDSVYIVAATGTMSAFDAMRAAQKEGLAFTSREYSGLGAFIDSIQGTKAPEGFTWILLFNHSTSTAGVSALQMHSGDSIEWVLDKNR